MLKGDKCIEQLPISQLPKPIKDADPNLKFAPLSRVVWKGVFINIGDFSVSIGKLKVELDWLKKVRDEPVMKRQS